jgi:DNA-binding protein HU-beta
VNKTELIAALAVHFDGNKAEASRALNAVLQTIIYKTATEDSVTILGFGAFEKTVRPARVVQDPRTGERHRVKALATPRFRPGSEFKAYVSGAKKVPKPPRTKAARTAARPARTGQTPSPPADKATPAPE